MKIKPNTKFYATPLKEYEVTFKNKIPVLENDLSFCLMKVEKLNTKAKERK